MEVRRASICLFIYSIMQQKRPTNVYYRNKKEGYAFKLRNLYLSDKLKTIFFQPYTRDN